MSANTTHAEHGDPQSHVPHILPLSTYLKTWGALLVLTVVTVAVSYVDFGSFNLLIALVVATAKASIVALVFMHLWFDNKFHSIILGVGLMFVAIFIGITLADTQTRGMNEAAGYKRPADVTNPFAGTIEDKALKTKWETSGAATTAPAAAPAEAEPVKAAEPEAPAEAPAEPAQP